MLKKILLLVFIIVIAFTFFACNTKEDSGLKFTSYGGRILLEERNFVQVTELLLNADDVVQSDAVAIDWRYNSNYTEKDGWQTAYVRDTVEKYDDTFFEDKAVIIFTYVMSDSRPCAVEKITLDGEVIKVDMVSRYRKYSMFAQAIVHRIFFVEIAKVDIVGANAVEVGAVRDIVTKN